MPTYEYECLRCGHEFEKFQSITDNPRKRCAECRGKGRRVIGSGAGILFKGSGFYETDYRSDGYKKAKKADSESGSKSSTESSSSSDSKKGESTSKSTKSKSGKNGNSPPS